MAEIKRALLIGLGSIGKKHLKSLLEIRPKIEVILFNRTKSNHSEVNKSGCSYFVSTIEEAIELKPDFGIICNPAPFHLDMALPLVKAGIHVLIEKPLCTNTDKVEDLLKISLKNKTVVMVGFNLRFLPSLLKFKEYLDQGQVGKVLSVRSEVGQNLENWRPGFDYRKSVSAKKSLGGGVLLELCHEIDYLLWIFGSGRASWVFSSLNRKSDLKIDVEDCADLILGLQDKKKEKEMVASLHLDFFRHDKTRHCTVIGDQGTLKWNAINGKIEFFCSKERKYQNLRSSKSEIDITYKEEIMYFIDCIEKNKVPITSTKEGYEVMKVIEAAKLSNQERKVIDIK